MEIQFVKQMFGETIFFPVFAFANVSIQRYHCKRHILTTASKRILNNERVHEICMAPTLESHFNGRPNRLHTVRKLKFALIRKLLGSPLYVCCINIVQYDHRHHFICIIRSAMESFYY